MKNSWRLMGSQACSLGTHLLDYCPYYSCQLVEKHLSADPKAPLKPYGTSPRDCAASSFNEEWHLQNSRWKKVIFTKTTFLQTFGTKSSMTFIW
jgi:hypothetical protein